MDCPHHTASWGLEAPAGWCVIQAVSTVPRHLSCSAGTHDHVLLRAAAPVLHYLVRVWALPLPGCVTSVKLLNFSVPLFFMYGMEIVLPPSLGYCVDESELIPAKHLEHCLLFKFSASS